MRSIYSLHIWLGTLDYIIYNQVKYIYRVKVVPGGYHRYLFRVKVKIIYPIGGRRFLAARSGLNVRTYSKLIEYSKLFLQLRKRWKVSNRWSR